MSEENEEIDDEATEEDEEALIKQAFTVANALLREDLRALLSLMHSQKELCLPVVNTLQTYSAAISLLEQASLALTSLRNRIDEAQRHADIHARRQKVWRMLCCKYALGEVKQQELFDQAFKDFVTTPPLHVDLDRELARLVGRLEELEQATTEFGELRQIVLE